jgi:methylamine dehydrogenase accessory protein MauD
MPAILAVARLVLIAILAVAGITKLTDQPGTRKAVVGFGVPEELSATVAIALPIAELAIAVALLPETTTWFAAIGAAGLLCVFITAIGLNLAQGRKPDCHCFGQLRSAPVGPSTLALNAALLAVASLIVWQGSLGNSGPSLVAWIGQLQTVELMQLSAAVLALALLAGIAALIWQLLRQQGRLLLRLDELEARLTGEDDVDVPTPEPAYDPLTMGAGLPVGKQAPAFELNAVQGPPVTLGHLLEKQKPLLLLFANPDCGPCLALLPEVTAWQRDHADAMSIVVVSEGNRKANRKKFEGHELGVILLQRDQEIAELYQAWGTPAALMVRPDGTIATRVAQGADNIRALVAWAMQVASSNANGAAAPLLGIGDRVPSVQLPDLAGKVSDVTNLGGRRTLLLFWNPGCGFCQEMLDDLRTWDANRSADEPELLVISGGTIEQNRTMKLRAPVLLDHGFKIAPMFGAHGTPMGVLLDERGTVASKVVVGAQAFFELANLSREPAPRPLAQVEAATV